MKIVSGSIVFLCVFDFSIAETLPGYENGVDPFGQFGSGNNPLSQYSNFFTGFIDSFAELKKIIPGIPGQDYPIYHKIPKTSFSCNNGRPRGYYADPETDCQLFHVCTPYSPTRFTKHSFLCPNGTIFSQKHLNCDWWFNVNCDIAETLFLKKGEIAAEIEANSGLLPYFGLFPFPSQGSGYSNSGNEYTAPANNKYDSPATYNIGNGRRF